MDIRDYEKEWPGLPIKYLIVASKDYIVFLDQENDIDWKTSDDFDLRIKTAQEKKAYYSVKNEIDSVKKDQLLKYSIGVVYQISIFVQGQFKIINEQNNNLKNLLEDTQLHYRSVLREIAQRPAKPGI